MNILLFDKCELSSDGQLSLSERALQHLRHVLRVDIGQRIRVGQINGPRGTARVARLEPHQGWLDEFQLDRPGGNLLDADLLLALPRPKMARRVIESAVQIGFRSIHLLNTWKVDKSYWQSQYLQPDSLQQTLLLGAEQAGVTCLPQVQLHHRFKPFAEDQLPAMLDNRLGLVADPSASLDCPVALKQPSLLAIGPEGGFTPYELDKLAQAGMQIVSLGDRILRVETALPLLSGRLYTSQSNFCAR